MPLTNAFSAFVRGGPAFASALARLVNQNLSDADPESWVEWLLYFHPALKKRMMMAEFWRA